MMAGAIQNQFQSGEIVRGEFAGYFAVLGVRYLRDDGRRGYQLKTINPDNVTETGLEELWLAEEQLRSVPDEAIQDGKIIRDLL